jgi:hypothetical protein
MRMASRLQASLAIVLMTVFFVSCSSVHATYVPDGRRGYVVSCGGYLNGWPSCLVKAGRACGNRGYETIKGSEDDRSILIACKIPGAPSRIESPPP